MKEYSRLIFYRDLEVLLQRLANGRYVYPGGGLELEDGDALEGLSRELQEETFMNASLRKSLVTDLMYFGAHFSHQWQLGKRQGVDHCFVLKFHESYSPITQVKDEEIAEVVWMPVVAVMCFNDLAYSNTMKETVLAMSLFEK